MGIEKIQAEAQNLVNNSTADIESTQEEKKTKVKELNELIKSFDDKIEDLKKTRKRFEDLITLTNTDLTTMIKKEKAKEAQKAWKEKKDKKEDKEENPEIKSLKQVAKEVSDKALGPKKKQGRPKKE